MTVKILTGGKVCPLRPGELKERRSERPPVNGLEYHLQVWFLSFPYFNVKKPDTRKANSMGKNVS